MRVNIITIVNIPPSDSDRGLARIVARFLKNPQPPQVLGVEEVELFLPRQLAHLRIQWLHHDVADGLFVAVDVGIDEYCQLHPELVFWAQVQC